MAVYYGPKNTASDNPWRQLDCQNKGALNKNVLDTFGFIFDKVLTPYFTNTINRVTDIKITADNTEYPNRSLTYDRSVSSNKVLINRDVGERMVMTYSIDINSEIEAKLPYQHQMDKWRHARSIELCNIEYGDDGYVDWFKDVTILLRGVEEDAQASIFVTLITTDYRSHIESAKKLKAVYNDESYFELWDTEVHDTRSDEVTVFYFAPEYTIPNEIIKQLKDTLMIKTDEDLVRFLKKYSYNKIQYKTFGTDQEDKYTVSYTNRLKMKCVNIESGILKGKSDTATYATKMEFNLRYTDIPMFSLMMKGLVLSNIHEPNYIKHKDTQATLAVNVVHSRDSIGETVRYESYELKLIDDDFREYGFDYDGKPSALEHAYRKENYLVLNMELVTPNGEVNEFIIDSLEEFGRYTEKVEECFNIELISKTKPEDQVRAVTRDTMTVTRDYISGEIIEKTLKPGESVYIAVYINYKKFNKWRKKRGYDSVSDNLSNKY